MKFRLFPMIGLALPVSLLWSQGPAATPRPPVSPFSLHELQAIPVTPPRLGKSVRKTLFDGKTLAGWRGNMDWWSVSDGAIAGRAKDRVPTSFLFTEDNYSDFRLTLLSKMVTSENHAGVCFWGEIATQNDNKWYTHGPLVVFPRPSMWDYNAAQGLRVYKTTTETVTSQHDWVKVEILAQGNRVRAAFNGVQVMEWREPDPSRIKEGPIGIQLHAFTEPQEVLYKDIVVESFPKEDRLITLKP
ncbi:MAG TPA: DUF1080 domain-containing protein [Bryobacteraceae bacterium]|nr:DUF1080 domain-containing protein [Bryobacteraceae bacterium]